MAPDRRERPALFSQPGKPRRHAAPQRSARGVVAENRRALELNPNAGENLEIDIVRVLILLERYDEAIAVMFTTVRMEKDRDYALALLYNAPGRKGRRRCGAEAPRRQFHGSPGPRPSCRNLCVPRHERRGVRLDDGFPGGARAQPGFTAAGALVFPGRNPHVGITDAASLRSPLDRVDELSPLTRAVL